MPPYSENNLPPLIARTLLFGNPERSAPQISPDGARLAFLAPRDGVMNLWVRPLSGGGGDAVPVTHEKVRPIPGFHWAENSRHLVYSQDKGGDENYHLYSVDIETGQEADLTPFENVQASLIGAEPSHPDTVLIRMNHRDPRLMDAYRVDLATAELSLIGENPGSYVAWIADHDLRVRAALANLPDGGSEVRARDNEAGEWRTLLRFDFGEQGSPIGFTPDNRGLYVSSNKDVDTQRLYILDIATGALTLLHSRDDADLSGALVHPTKHTVQAVAYNRARQEWVALDPQIEADLRALGEQAEGDFTVTSRSRDDAAWVVEYIRDDDPVAYYVYDRAARNVTFLFTARPDLEAATLAKMLPVEIPARDGLRLQSYLTLPPGVEAKQLPLVLCVHGGPWARNLWGFSATVQWLANRGYAVLEVNYRGSTGFGKAFINAGNREWAGKMHDDLVDAVEWAVQNGYADPNRVAIFGGSYGGYAALVGLTFTPELFACGVDIVGPSSLLTLMASIPPYWAPLRAQFVRRIGDPETEEEFLKSRSPLFFADRIVRPLLIAQGANDPRVKQAESDQVVEAMRRNGQEVLYLLFEDEGHGFARPENRLKFYAAAEKFLADHLGGRYEPAHPGEEAPVS